MQRTHAFVVVLRRAFATLVAICVIIGAARLVHAAELELGEENPPPSVELEPWQLETESVGVSIADERLPALSPEDEEFLDSPLLMEEYVGTGYQWRWLPEGLIYHSYWAGVHEPRLGITMFQELSDSRFLWDATLGGRVGMLQYGNGDPYSPAGFQIDFYGAAIARLDTENRQDLDSTDYVFGLPFTWGDERLQFKTGYAHISSHLGDEYAISHPGSLNDRINYVRDSWQFGVSYYSIPALRTYGEIDWAFHRSGGARPLALQFGAELSRPGPTNGRFSPFLATNARLRQEHDFGGDITFQAGWLRRNMLDQTLRFGLHLYSGKSSQSQFFTNSEQQVGIGLWYDF